MDVITALLDKITFDEAFFVLIAFIGFVFVFIKYAWPPIANILDARADTIRQQLAEATKLREEAQATLAAYQKRQREVMEETEKMLEHAKIQVENIKVDAEADLKQAISRRMNQAKERIARAEKEAVASLQSTVSDASLNAAETIIHEMIESQGDDGLTASAINDAKRLVG